MNIVINKIVAVGGKIVANKVVQVLAEGTILGIGMELGKALVQPLIKSDEKISDAYFEETAKVVNG